MLPLYFPSTLPGIHVLLLKWHHVLCSFPVSAPAFLLNTPCSLAIISVLWYFVVSAENCVKRIKESYRHWSMGGGLSCCPPPSPSSLQWLPERSLREVDPISDLLLWTPVFKFKNGKSLLSLNILLPETIWRGPGRCRVPTPNNTMKLNWVIEPSGSQKTHPNYGTEKSHHGLYRDVGRTQEKKNKYGSIPSGLATLESRHYPSERKDKRKEWFQGLENTAVWLWLPVDGSSQPSRVRGKAGEPMTSPPLPSDLLPSTDPNQKLECLVAFGSALREQPLKTDSRVERVGNGFERNTRKFCSTRQTDGLWLSLASTPFPDLHRHSPSIPSLIFSLSPVNRHSGQLVPSFFSCHRWRSSLVLKTVRSRLACISHTLQQWKTWAFTPASLGFPPGSGGRKSMWWPLHPDLWWTYFYTECLLRNLSLWAQESP